MRRSEVETSMSMPWILLLMLRPFRGYAELAAQIAAENAAGDDGADRRRASVAALVAALGWLTIVGLFVSFATAGRLVAFHVVGTMVAWSFVPMLQGAALALIAKRVPEAGATLGTLVRLHYAGQGPFYALLLLLIAVCLFAPSTVEAFTWLLGRGVLPVIGASVFLWSALLTFAAFCSGVGMSRGRSALATLLFYAVYVGGILLYFALTDQLVPLIMGDA